MTTQPTDPTPPVAPTPDPAPVAPTPDKPTPPVIGPPPFPATDLTKTSWWQWALTTLISLAVGVGTLIGHPFDSALVSAIVPSVALVAAAVATAFQVHGVHATKVALINYQSSLHSAQLWADQDTYRIKCGR